MRQRMIANPQYLADPPLSVAWAIANDEGKASSIRRLQNELRQQSAQPPRDVLAGERKSTMLEPDWPIAELFRHINPAVVDEKAPWPISKETGRAILDKLAIGQLSAWGRRDWDDYGDDQCSSTQVPIRREYWETRNGRISSSESRAEKAYIVTCHGTVAGVKAIAMFR